MKRRSDEWPTEPTDNCKWQSKEKRPNQKQERGVDHSTAINLCPKYPNTKTYHFLTNVDMKRIGR